LSKSLTQRREKGFTLIELVVVLLLVSLTLVTILPRFENLTGGGLEKAARRLAAVLQHLYTEASATNQLFELHYDFGEQTYWYATATIVQAAGNAGEPTEDVLIQPIRPPTRLPSGIRLEDVMTPRQGKVGEGEAITRFFPAGFVEPTVIHLADEDRNGLTLVVQPMTGRVKILEGYVEFR
jgi:general secretion pathway protein H